MSLGRLPKRNSFPIFPSSPIFSLQYRNLADEEIEVLTVPTFFPGSDSWNRSKSVRGFNLNYIELAVMSIVDPYFDLSAIFHFCDGEVGLEEVYVRTQRLPFGLQLKVGKFLSDFGRFNAQHEHSWNFKDRPLVHRTFFGPEGLNEKGLQVSWVASLPFFLKLGLEVFQGENDVSFGRVGFEEVLKLPFPNLWVGFAKASADFGNLAIWGGVSFALGGRHCNRLQDAPTVNGDTRIWCVDLCLKFPFDSDRSLSLQGEYLNRHFGGQMDKDAPVAMACGQSGYYAELIWRIDRRYQWGVRFEWVGENRRESGCVQVAQPADMMCVAMVLDFSPSEFSRFRLQIGQDRSRYQGDEGKPFYEFSLGLNMAIGAHSDHVH